MTWQPIETAPKDGRWILVVCGWEDFNGRPSQDWARIVKWVGGIKETNFPWAVMDCEGVEGRGSIGKNVPTHWMPLPPPPETTP